MKYTFERIWGGRRKLLPERAMKNLGFKFLLYLHIGHL